MLRFALLFVAMVLIAGAAAWYADHPGLITIEWQGWLVEASLGMMIVALLAAVLLLLLLYKFLHWLLQGPQAYRRAALERRRKKGYSAVSEGLVAVAAGDTPLALRQAQRADQMLDENPLSLLLSAQAAQLEGDDAKAKACFQAMRDRADTEFLGLRGLLSYARREGDDAKALELARRAYQLKPKADWVSRELVLLEADNGQWDNASRVLKQAEKRKTIAGAELDRQQIALLLARADQAEARGDINQAVTLAQKAFAIRPMPAAGRVIRLIRKQSMQRKADKFATQAWNRSPNRELARQALEMLPQENPENRLKRLENMTAGNKDHRESRILIAEAAKEAGDFVKARNVIGPALSDQPDKFVCRFMATLSEEQGRDLDAAREWLQRASEAPEPETWVCQSCHDPQDRWTTNCPACGEFASLEWQQVAMVGTLTTGQPTEVAEEISAELTVLQGNQSVEIELGKDTGEGTAEPATAKGA